MILFPRYARLVSLVVGCCLIGEVALLSTKAGFLLAATLTSIAGVAIVYAIGRAKRESPRPLELLYATGVMGAMAGYCYLALAPSGAVAEGDAVIDWGLLDKRPFVIGYLVAGTFIAFHWLLVRFAQADAAKPAPASRRRLGPLQVAAAIAVAFIAEALFGVPTLYGVATTYDTTLARFFDLHSHVHLSALEQIRLGAVPYLEAQTQYGVGNQILMSWLTDRVHYSNHGFFAANLLLNALCIVIFFVVVQQTLGLAWALAGMVGWLVWPSPMANIDLAGWMVLTRWMAIPVLALCLGRILATGASQHAWLPPLMTGAGWGVGAFLAQESFTGGLLVLALSLAVLGPASGRSLRQLAIFAATFVVAGLGVFGVLVGSFVGFSHIPQVLALASAKSRLVTAGLSNSIWSDSLGISLGFKVIHGRLYTAFEGYGELRELILTYGAALLLVMALAAICRFLVRRWSEVSDADRRLAWKCAALAIGAFVLHLFALLRSDTSHLAAPSFLLPLLLLVLPIFAWRCLDRGSASRRVLLPLSLIIVAEGVVSGGGNVLAALRALPTAPSEARQALEVYRELRDHRGGPLDLASRYSPIAEYQTGLRAHPDFGEAQEFLQLLQERLKGRRLELGFYKFDDLVAHPDTFYFLGGIRALSGITSPKNSIWLRSERDAWIATVAGKREGCVFFEPDPKGELFDAWMRSAAAGTVTLEPIEGRRRYGVLACKN